MFKNKFSYFYRIIISVLKSGMGVCSLSPSLSLSIFLSLHLSLSISLSLSLSLSIYLLLIHIKLCHSVKSTRQTNIWYIYLLTHFKIIYGYTGVWIILKTKTPKFWTHWWQSISDWLYINCTSINDMTVPYFGYKCFKIELWFAVENEKIPTLSGSDFSNTPQSPLIKKTITIFCGVKRKTPPPH